MDIRKYQKMALPAACVFLFVFLLMIVFFKNGILDLNRKKGELKEATARNEELRDENRGLYREVTRLNSDQEYLEQVARKELGMIRKDEIIVKFHSDGNPEGEPEKEPEKEGASQKAVIETENVSKTGEAEKTAGTVAEPSAEKAVEEGP